MVLTLFKRKNNLIWALWSVFSRHDIPISVLLPFSGHSDVNVDFAFI